MIHFHCKNNQNQNKNHQDLLEYAIDFPLALLGRSPYIGFSKGSLNSEQRPFSGAAASGALFGALIRHAQKHKWTEETMLDTGGQKIPPTGGEPGLVQIEDPEQGFSRELYLNENVLPRMLNTLRSIVLQDEELINAAPAVLRREFADRYLPLLSSGSSESVASSGGGIRLSLADRVGVRSNADSSVWIHFGGGEVPGDDGSSPSPTTAVSALHQLASAATFYEQCSSSPSVFLRPEGARFPHSKKRLKSNNLTPEHCSRYRTPRQLGYVATNDGHGAAVPRVHHWRLFSQTETRRLIHAVSTPKFATLEPRIFPVVNALRERVTLLVDRLWDEMGLSCGTPTNAASVLSLRRCGPLTLDPEEVLGRNKNVAALLTFAALAAAHWWAVDTTSSARTTAAAAVGTTSERFSKMPADILWHSGASSDDVGRDMAETFRKLQPEKTINNQLVESPDFLARLANFFLLGPDKGILRFRYVGRTIVVDVFHQHRIDHDWHNDNPPAYNFNRGTKLYAGGLSWSPRPRSSTGVVDTTSTSHDCLVK